MRTYKAMFLVMLCSYCSLVFAEQHIEDKYSFDWGEVKQFENDPDMQRRLEMKRQVEQNLARSTQLIISEVQLDDIVSWVTSANGHRGEMDEITIMALDAKWQTSDESDPFIQNISVNRCANKLKEFQARHREFVEIFVTDNIGVNICQTNKTSDYYQADETWWTTTFNGKGAINHSPLKYDDSAQTFAVGIHLPIVDPKTKKIVGVAKALVKTRYNEQGIRL